MLLDLPCHHEFDPLTLGEFGVDGFERLVAQRAQACAVLAKGLDDLRIHPRFGPDEKEAMLILHATQIVQIEIATIRQQQRAPQGHWLRQERLFIGRIRG